MCNLTYKLVYFSYKRDKKKFTFLNKNNTRITKGKFLLFCFKQKQKKNQFNEFKPLKKTKKWAER